MLTGVRGDPISQGTKYSGANQPGAVTAALDSLKKNHRRKGDQWVNTPEERQMVRAKEIGAVIDPLADSFNHDLLALSDQQISAEWYWWWDEKRSAEWNTYEFSDILELHKRRWRRWEEHHNGPCCVVERVRDKYVMPRVREFLATLARNQGGATNGARKQAGGSTHEE